MAYINAYATLTGSNEDIFKVVQYLTHLEDWFHGSWLFSRSGNPLNSTDPDEIVSHIENKALKLYGEGFEKSVYLSLIAPTENTISSLFQSFLLTLAQEVPSVEYTIDFDDEDDDNDGFCVRNQCTYKDNRIQVYRQKYSYDMCKMSEEEYNSAAEYFSKRVTLEHYIELKKRARYYDYTPPLEYVNKDTYIKFLVDELSYQSSQPAYISENAVDGLLRREDGITWLTYLDSDVRI